MFGTRPEIIRLSRIFTLLDKNFEHVMINTMQNFSENLNKIFFQQLGIREPDYNFNINTGDYGTQVSEIIKKSDEVFQKEKPDILLVLGDTNSSLCVLPASHYGIKIFHLEAGMRSYDWRMPEEKNRVLIDHLSNILLPYTDYSRENLIRENIHPSKIFVVGNPIIQVINHYDKKINDSKIMQKLGVKNNDYFLVTAHRSENVDDPETLQNILLALQNIHTKFRKRVIFPIHPRTISKMKHKPKGIDLIAPLGFFDFTKLEKNAFCLVSDSGTIPEESLYFGRPCVTIRKSTERPEFVEAGSNIIAGLNPQNILESVHLITSHKQVYYKWNRIFGDGNTAMKVINIIRGVI